MITLLHTQATDSVKHSALRHLQGKLRSFYLVWFLLTNVVCVSALAQTPPPLVALASSFRGPWPELMQAYRSETGQAEPRTSFGSSGSLTTQIRHGAPFELYLSADQTTVQQLRNHGKTRDPSITLAHGSLSLIWPRVSKLLATTGNATSATPHTREITSSGLDFLARKLQRRETFKLAIPNPRHAPYGIASRQALASANLWPLPTGYLLNAQNAAQTLQFALSGAVDYAIVPDTLVYQLTDSLHKIPIAPERYDPVIHQLVLLNPAGPDAHVLFEWLQGTTAATIMTRFGLTPE